MDLTPAARGAQEFGLAAMLGGNLYGRFALHPALARVSDERERGAVVNAAWRRYGIVNSLGLAALVAGWAGERLADGRPSPLARAKDLAVAAVALTGLAAGAEGVRFSRSAPGGAVPLADGSTPSDRTPPGAARQKRLLNVLGAANIGAELALAGIDAAMASRRPRRRRLPLV